MLALNGGDWAKVVTQLGAARHGWRGILVCSAHWETQGPVRLTSAEMPGVLHDFGGFPEALYQLDYPAPGSLSLAREALALLEQAGIEAALDPARPLDHGAWVPLRHLVPEADIPVVQLSLPAARTPQSLLAMGRALAPLSQSGVLILGSGGIVHNLRCLDWSDLKSPEPWAAAFDAWMRERLAAGDQASLLGWRKAPGAAESVPTSEHLDPLFVALGAGSGPAQQVFQGWQLGNLSLASYQVG